MGTSPPRLRSRWCKPVQRTHKALEQMNMQRTEVIDGTGADLRRIDGPGLDPWMKGLSEIGTESAHWGNAERVCSWRGLCQAASTGGGKVLAARTGCSAKRVPRAPRRAAIRLTHSGSALGALYRRSRGRLDTPRANTAAAHRPARLVCVMLTRGRAAANQDQQRCEEQHRKRRAAALELQISPAEAAA